MASVLFDVVGKTAFGNPLCCSGFQEDYFGSLVLCPGLFLALLQFVHNGYGL